MDAASKRNSTKLDIEAVRLSAAEEQPTPKEIYKSLPDSDHTDELENVNLHNSVKNSNMVREKSDHVEDGADEKMEEVKFISGDQQNGDAKIDIGTIDKAFSGMTKDELMKFANDPFWVRLRWFLFIIFWLLWAGMLVGAIMIIIYAPKCAAPVDLSWWKQGPLVTLKDANNDAVSAIKAFGAKGVIYELPSDNTYTLKNSEYEDKIKQLVDSCGKENLNVIVDVTPNFVTADDELYKKALSDNNQRTPFIWSSTEQASWQSLVNGSAWHKVNSEYILGQFGPNRYDLQMSEPIVKERLKDVFRHLVELGVKGFRLANVKHFIVDREIKEEKPADNHNYVHTQYGFWTHTHSTYQEGLGELLFEFSRFVHNITNGDGFLSVVDDINRPEAIQVKNNINSLDMIQLGKVPTVIADGSTAEHIYKELQNVMNSAGERSWLQWPYIEKSAIKHITISEYNIFLMLLPGVPIVSTDYINSDDKNSKLVSVLETIRSSPSYMHGSFAIYQNEAKSVIGYSRIKAGNPGYFVILNPTDGLVDADFKNVTAMADELTVHTLSANYNVTNIAVKGKVSSKSIPISAHSAIILTYVPKSE